MSLGGEFLWTIVRIVVAFGVPVLALLFYAEGLVIGKIARPGLVFLVYVGIVAPTRLRLVGLVTMCALTMTLGQWTLYRGFSEEAPEFVGLQRRVPYLDRLPVWIQERVGQRRLQIVERRFERYGGVGLAVSNVIPGIRGLMAIPAGLNDYPVNRFLVASTVGNAAYLGLLVGAAYGMRSAFRFVWVF